MSAELRRRIMNEQMKKVGRAMSLKMGLAMSFCMSLIGTGTSGHFTIPGFLISFVLSFIISLIIGFAIPMGRVSAAACRAMKLKQGSLPARIVESFISNLIYTPVMTVAMVAFAYFMAMKQSGGKAQLSFAGMLIPSLIICFIAGFFIIFIIQPIFLRQTMAKYGVAMNMGGKEGGPQDARNDN